MSIIDEAELRRLAELALHGDPTDLEPWACIGCGADSPRKIRPCKCPSGLVFIRSDLRRHAEYSAEAGPEVPVPVPAATLMTLLAERTRADKAEEDLNVIHRAAAYCQGKFGGRMSEVDRIFQEITRVSAMHKTRAALEGRTPDGGEAVHSQPIDQAPAEPPSSSNTEG